MWVHKYAFEELCNKFLWLRNTRNMVTEKPVLSMHSKRIPKIGFQDWLPLNAGQKYCRMLQESILQNFRPSLSYHISLRPLFCQSLSGRLRQDLLYFLFNSYSANEFLSWKCHLLFTSAAYNQRHFSDYFLITEANTMNPDQTAPKGAVWSGSILFAI